MLIPLCAGMTSQSLSRANNAIMATMNWNKLNGGNPRGPSPPLYSTLWRLAVVPTTFERDKAASMIIVEREYYTICRSGVTAFGHKDSTLLLVVYRYVDTATSSP